MSSPLNSVHDDKPPRCLSPQDKLKGSLSKTSLSMSSRKKTHTAINYPVSMAVDFDMADAATIDLEEDMDLELMEDDDDDDAQADQDMDGWISDDNLRALEFDDRLNQEIDWVAHDEGSLKLTFVPTTDDEEQDFAFDPSSFLSPLRGSLSFDGADVASSFAESLSVDTPPPSFGTSHDAEKLLMSFDTMNFTIPSPTSGSSKKRASLFGKNDGADAATKDGGKTEQAKGTTSPSFNGKASDDSRKDDALPKIAIPGSGSGTTEQLLGVLSITTPTATSLDPQRKIGSYSPEARRLRIQKFHEKRKNRTWKKSIKYDCRKKLADDRPRIKGRFVRVLENADVKEEDACSTASTASTSASSPRSPVPSTDGATSVITPVMQVLASAVAAATLSVAPAPVQPSPAVVTAPQPSAPVPAPVPAESLAAQ